jgi:hypothetical protein
MFKKICIFREQLKKWRVKLAERQRYGKSSVSDSAAGAGRPGT